MFGVQAGPSILQPWHARTLGWLCTAAVSQSLAGQRQAQPHTSFPWYTPPSYSVPLVPSSTKCHSRRFVGEGWAVILGTGSFRGPSTRARRTPQQCQRPRALLPNTSPRCLGTCMTRIPLLSGHYTPSTSSCIPFANGSRTPCWPSLARRQR
jgi:hypothetical protein